MVGGEPLPKRTPKPSASVLGDDASDTMVSILHLLGPEKPVTEAEASARPVQVPVGKGASRNAGNDGAGRKRDTGGVGLLEQPGQLQMELAPRVGAFL